MKRFLFILIPLILISCDNSTTATNCTDNCSYNGEIICKDDSLQVCKKLTNGCLAFEKTDCQKNSVCSEDGIPQCVCDNGFYDNNGVCESNDNLCNEKVCQEHSTCEVRNGDATCICDDDFHLDGDDCISNIKEDECTDNHPINATSTIAKVQITWNKEKNSWNIVNCEWSCNQNYQKEGEQCVCDNNFHTEDENISCISNTKEVNCKDIAPADAESKFIKVDVTWNEDSNSWNEPIDCEWNCKSDFHLDVSCISNTKKENCIPVDPLPENSTSKIKEVDVTWDEGIQDWNPTPTCEWSCNQGYHLNDSGDCIEDTVNVVCEGNSCTETNKTICTVENNTIVCSCDEGYEENDNQVCVCNNADEITRFNINQSLDNAYQIVFENNIWNRNNLNTYKPLVCDYNGTEDWYKISLRAREYFNFKVIPTSGDAVIELYANEDSSNRLAYVDSRGEAITETLVVGTPIEKVFYIKVKSYNPDSLLEYSINSTRGNHNMSTESIYSIHPSYDFWKNRTHYTSNWNTAKDRCNNNTGHLIKIDNEAENNLIKDQIVGDSWIGLTDSDNEGTWKWTDDSSLNISNWSISPWNSGEPNDGGRFGNEDCAEIDTDGKWNDSEYWQARSFICEY